MDFGWASGNFQLPNRVLQRSSVARRGGSTGFRFNALIIQRTTH
jgi:hypothetical protein